MIYNIWYLSFPVWLTLLSMIVSTSIHVAAVQFSSVTQLCLTLCDPMDCSTPGLPIHDQLLEFTQLMSIELVTPSSHIILCCPLSSCLQSFPASGSFPMGWLFLSDGQSIGISTSASVFPMNIQGWFLLRMTGLISLQSKGLSRVFSSTTVRKYQFFSAQSSLWSNSHICTWLLEKPQLWLCGPLSTK